MVKRLPKLGDRIPADKLHISKMNVNYGEPFGQDEKDKNLTGQLRRGRIVQKFTARPEDDGYGVVIGRRRFLSKKTVGTKEFVVGKDCEIVEMTDEEAREASWIENLDLLRKGMNPIRRAEQLSTILAFSPLGLRGMARRWQIAPSTLSEWLKILELSPKMQGALAEGKVQFKEALTLARLKLGTELQDKLAELLVTEGLDAFKRELARIVAKKGKRGIPKGVYEVDRLTWDKRSREEMRYYEIVMKAAETKKMKTREYIKDFLIRHIDEIAKETA